MSEKKIDHYVGVKASKVLYEEKIDHYVGVTASKVLQVKQITTLLKNGVKKSEEYSRYTLTPGQSADDQPDVVRQVAAAVWTPEVIAAFQASQQ